MKFLLSLIICSSVAGECMPPFEWPETFKSKYDCLHFGYEESQRKLEEIGREDINKYGMYIKFTCRIDDSIWQCGQIMVMARIFSPLPTLNFYPSLG